MKKKPPPSPAFRFYAVVQSSLAILFTARLVRCLRPTARAFGVRRHWAPTSHARIRRAAVAVPLNTLLHLLEFELSDAHDHWSSWRATSRWRAVCFWRMDASAVSMRMMPASISAMASFICAISSSRLVADSRVVIFALRSGVAEKLASLGSADSDPGLPAVRGFRGRAR